MGSLYALQQEHVGPSPNEKLLLASAARWGRKGDAVAPARPVGVVERSVPLHAGSPQAHGMTSWDDAGHRVTDARHQACQHSLRLYP